MAEHKPRVLAVLAAVGLLCALPQLLSPGLLNAAIQMLIAALFACAYNLLCGQAGMLSFGHAAYFGVGAFATVHAMNAVHGTGLLPTPLMPLAGGLAGLCFGAAMGWFATQRSGTYFAMITLAIAELVHALAPHLSRVFGGEAGISTLRQPAWGFSFATTTELYYLDLAWVLACLALMWGFTATPLGRLALGLRENTQRLRFLGYDVHRVSVAVFALSGAFSGVAGGLQVLGNEAINYVVFEAHVSAAVVLNAYIGGVQAFLGPALGAALMTFFGYAVSDLTQSWLLYQGLLFVAVMLFMPTGLVGLVQHAAEAWRRQGLVQAAPLWAARSLAVLALAAAFVFSVELLQRLLAQDYRAALAAGADMAAGAWPPVRAFGLQWQPGSPATWAVPLALGLCGVLALRLARRLQAGAAEAAPATPSSDLNHAPPAAVAPTPPEAATRPLAAP